VTENRYFRALFIGAGGWMMYEQVDWSDPVNQVTFALVGVFMLVLGGFDLRRWLRKRRAERSNT
jgi:hypothetical protein